MTARGHGLDEQQRTSLVEAASAAPSLMNTQPWTFVVGPDRVEVRADDSRRLEHADPHGRSMLVSCGASLLNLRVAADALAVQSRVHVLPDAGDPDLVATLEVLSVGAVPGPLAALHPAVPRRHTNRSPFTAEPVPGSVRRRLEEAAGAEGARLHVLEDDAEVDLLLGLLRDAEVEERADPAVLPERLLWLAPGDRPDGVPMEALGPLPASARAATRDLGARAADPDELAGFERQQTLAVLSTRGDDRADWLRAGQALERVLLTATLDGLSASFLNQAVDRPGLRPRIPVAAGAPHAQMVMRLGYGAPVAPTPRRRAGEVSRPGVGGGPPRPQAATSAAPKTSAPPETSAPPASPPRAGRPGSRVSATPPARRALRELRAEHGPVVLVYPTDGSGADALRCLPAAVLRPDPGLVLVGLVEDCPFYVPEQVDSARRSPTFVLDVEHGAPPAGSLGPDRGLRFVSWAWSPERSP